MKEWWRKGQWEIAGDRCEHVGLQWRWWAPRCCVQAAQHQLPRVSKWYVRSQFKSQGCPYTGQAVHVEICWTAERICRARQGFRQRERLREVDDACCAADIGGKTRLPNSVGQTRTRLWLSAQRSVLFGVGQHLLHHRPTFRKWVLGSQPLLYSDAVTIGPHLRAPLALFGCEHGMFSFPVRSWSLNER